MTPEARHPHNAEHEDPATARFMKAIENATVGGSTLGDCKYKFHRAGALLVATVHRIYSPVYSVYSQDKRSGSHPVISGIEFDRELDTLKRNVPQVSINLNQYARQLEEQVVGDLHERAVAAGYTTYEEVDDDDPVYEPDDFLTKLINQLDNPPVPENFWDRIWERVDFEDEMTEQGIRDAKPENILKVSEALEIVAGTGLWKRREKLSRAETLFREGLGLKE